MKNPFWLVFLGLIAVSVFGYTIYTCVNLYEYYRLGERVSVQHIDWKVDQLGADHFVPHATYQFDLNGKSYEGNSLWNEAYLNEWTAQEMIHHLSAWPAKVWVDPYFPSYSALQKNFPYKQCISSFILWLLLVYFVGLGKYADQQGETCKPSS